MSDLPVTGRNKLMRECLWHFNDMAQVTKGWLLAAVLKPMSVRAVEGSAD